MPIGGGRKNMRAQRMAVFGCTALLAVRRGSVWQLERRRQRPAGRAARPRAGGGNADTVILGTTDKVVSLDPAGAYDLGSQQLIGNMYQNLLSIPAGGNKPEPDAAESCEFTDPKTYVCKLKPDLKFSSGDPLTSEDVKFSLDRSSRSRTRAVRTSLLGSLDIGRGDRSDDRDDEAQEGRRHVALHPHPQRRRDRPGRDLPGRRQAARRQGDRLGPVQAGEVHAQPAGRVHDQPELQRARTRARRANFIVQYFEQAVGAEAGDRAG